MKEQATTHLEQIEFLRKIEGQIRGIQKMVEEGRYCVDILTQIRSIMGALTRVESEIFKKHVNGCVFSALKGRSEIEKQKKIEETLQLISRFGRAT